MKYFIFTLIILINQFAFATSDFQIPTQPVVIEINEVDSKRVTESSIYYAKNSELYLEAGECSGEQFGDTWGFVYVFYNHFGPFDKLFGGFKLPRAEGVSCTDIHNELNKASSDNSIFVEIDFKDKTVRIL